jgi:hypothetical protein
MESVQIAALEGSSSFYIASLRRVVELMSQRRGIPGAILTRLAVHSLFLSPADGKKRRLAVQTVASLSISKL